MFRLGTARAPITYKGRRLGVLVLVAAQLLVGAIHVAFGFWLLSAQGAATGAALNPGLVYSVYTVLFGLLTLVFAAGIWLRRSWSWWGTAAVAVFVIVADSLTLLDLPSIPGIPKFAGLGEITYSVLVLFYLLEPQTRKEYAVSKK
jgi:hypothetical protein